MDCYACDNQATRQCRHCSRVYCEVHGDDLCAECLRPASALPSFNLYRGSLLVLLIGTAVSLWLLVRPPGTGDGEEVALAVTATAVVSAATETPDGPALDSTGTPGLTPTSTIEATPTAALRTYEVQPGDTIGSIAAQFAPPGVDDSQYQIAIILLNGLEDEDALMLGQVLLLPN